MRIYKFIKYLEQVTFARMQYASFCVRNKANTLRFVEQFISYIPRYSEVRLYVFQIVQRLPLRQQQPCLQPDSQQSQSGQSQSGW